MCYFTPCPSSLSHDMVAARTSKEDICVTLCQLLVEAGRAALSQTPSTAITVMLSTCGNKCAHRRRSIMAQKSTAVDGSNSDTRSIQVVSFHLRVSITLCQWLLRALTLAHCVG